MSNFYQKSNLKELVLLFLTFFGCGCLLYYVTLHAEFNFDDNLYIVGNRDIKTISNFQYFWDNKTRLIGFYSFALNYYFSAFDPFVYRLTNLFIHALSALFCFLFTLRLLQTPLISGTIASQSAKYLSLFVAVLFFVHPIQSEVVAYITQRFEAIAGLFYFMTIYFYLTARQGTKLLFIPAIAAMIACMFSKEISYTLIPMLLLVEVTYFDFNSEKKTIYLSLLAVGLGIVGALLYMFYGGKIISAGLGSVLRLETNVSRLDYFLTQLYVLFYYLRLLIIPFGLNIDHDIMLRTSFADPVVLLSLILHLTIIFFVLVNYHKRRLPCFCVIWYYLTLSVTSSFIPIKDLAFEHRLYLSSYALYLLLAYLIFSGTRQPKLRGTLCAIIILILAGFTVQRANAWRSEINLWSDAYSKSPQKPRTSFNLGMAYRRAGNELEASKYILKAADLQIQRGNYDYHSLIIFSDAASVYINQGDLTKGLDLIKRISLLPFTNIDTYHNIGTIFYKLGDYKKAQGYFEDTIKANPCHAEALNNLGVIAAKDNAYDQALSYLSRAIACKPDYANARFNLAMISLSTNNIIAGQEQLRAIKYLNRPDLEEALSAKIAHRQK
ncbi:MAG: tetratricopeptide repeat protein [Deltaproteobacteria bacterium]|nr:tetratricopeptide repeat protein [Deltaproteobacteria bacterium]